MAKSYWMPVACDGENHRETIKSWFSPLCDDMRVESADVLCDAETDREKKARAVMIDVDGNRFMAVRTTGKNYSVSCRKIDAAKATA